MQGITVTEVRGISRQRDHAKLYRGAEYQVNFLPKTKMEVVVSDELLEQALESIIEYAATDNLGDGKIFVTDLVEFIRIRTGETGPSVV